MKPSPDTSKAGIPPQTAAKDSGLFHCFLPRQSPFHLVSACLLVICRSQFSHPTKHRRARLSAAGERFRSLFSRACPAPPATPSIRIAPKRQFDDEGGSGGPHEAIIPHLNTVYALSPN